jgi:nicotinamidase/pyrazinamidase
MVRRRGHWSFDMNDNDHSALLITDVQFDFLPRGSLGVPKGDAILKPLAALMESRRFPIQVATQDWHPPGHISFASSHEGRDVMDAIQLYGHEQILWPDHCVQDSHGAELYPNLPWRHVQAIVRKGANPLCDSYSAFRNNWDADGERPPTGLAGLLHERRIQHVWLCGLARDVCVRWTARDAVEEGFQVTVLWDLTRPVDPASDDEVRSELEGMGIAVMESGALR